MNLLLWRESKNTLSAVIDATIPMMRVSSAVQLLAGLVIVQAAILRGLRDMTASIWIIALSYWAIGLGSAWLFGVRLGGGGVGIWGGIAIGFLASFATLQFRYRRALANLHLARGRAGGDQSGASDWASGASS